MNDTATTVTEETGAQKRARQLREAKRRERQRKRDIGSHTLQVTLNRTEMEALQAAHDMYAGAPNDFLSRALVTGAKFLANSGNVRGGKVRLK